LGAPQGLAHVEAVQAETERCLISDNRILAIQSVTTRVVDSAVVVEAEVLTPLGPLSFNLPISA
jgi:hypothetical protein